jgi:hypothetical protein
MRKKVSIALSVALYCTFASPLRAAQPALASADWSVNGAHNLASNPPSVDAVEDFTGRAIGESEDNPPVDVCEFRFADLRSSGNLSLIVSVAPGSWGCTELYIFDRTPTGFELYHPTAAGVVAHDLANSVLDINHDGRHELVLWGDLAPFATGFSFGELGCAAKWPLIFAWTGNGYSEVGNQYKDYYQSYLKSLDTRLATYSSELEEASTQAANRAPAVGGAAEQTRVKTSQFAIGGQTQAEISSGPGGDALAAREWTPPQIAAPAPTPGATLNLAQRDYPCARIEAAKTEEFLGIDSDSMSAAIKDSESDEPNKRILAAVIFSYLGTHEAQQNLKTLSNDADSRVAGIAKEAASFGEDPSPSARTISRQGRGYIDFGEPRQSKP